MPAMTPLCAFARSNAEEGREWPRLLLPPCEGRLVRDLLADRLTIWLVEPPVAREVVVRERSVRLSRGGNKPLVSSDWLSSSSSGVGRCPLTASVDWGCEEQISGCYEAKRTGLAHTGWATGGLEGCVICCAAFADPEMNAGWLVLIYAA